MPVSGKKQPRKRGRPAKPPSQRKRNNVTTRMRDQLKERLEGEARPSDRSLSEEIEFRLERSFLDDARFAALMGEDGGEMAQLFGAAIRTASLLAKTKKSYREDAANYALVEFAIRGILVRLRPGLPSSKDLRLYESIGNKIAEMHVKSLSKEIAAQLGGEWSALRPSTKESE